MVTLNSPIVNQIEDLSDIDKLQLVDIILEQLDRPDPEIDKVWTEEAKRRWQAYKDGQLATVSYHDVMSKYKTK